MATTNRISQLRPELHHNLVAHNWTSTVDGGGHTLHTHRGGRGVSILWSPAQSPDPGALTLHVGDVDDDGHFTGEGHYRIVVSGDTPDRVLAAIVGAVTPTARRH